MLPAKQRTRNTPLLPYIMRFRPRPSIRRVRFLPRKLHRSKPPGRVATHPGLMIVSAGRT
ncbi:hypothetical protein DPMN_162118 [Dreissena polymorpha]|uniref:Uncharacterized protein n=1 Tax=Dreissena polymorpha TaxID=45954 RepID=A0A9D4ETE8_DREPO|nr:hypothetical protein DPMN_162118 [Dreissena polymorpha]